jgi:PAS domain S-box-containing protein
MKTQSSNSSGARMRGRFSGRLSNRPAGGRHKAFRRIPEFHRLVVESLTEYAVLTTDKDLQISSWSGGAATMLGYAEKEIIGKSISIIFTPEDIAKGIDKSEFAHALKKGRMDDERWHVCKDGRRLWCYGLSFPLKDEGGTVRGFVKLIRDDTTRKAQDDSLRESEERFRLAAESTGLGIWSHEIVTRKLKLSTRARYLFGLKKGARASYKKLFEAVEAEDLDRVTKAFHHSWAKEGPDTSSLEYRVRMPDGTSRWVYTMAKAFYDPHTEETKPIRIIGTIVDITEHKQALAVRDKVHLELEGHVKERTATLTGLNKELETFAYSASHDLRAPLRKIQDFSQAILQRGKLDADDQEYFTSIRTAASHMNHLIDEILNLSKVTQQPINVIDCDLSAIAEKIAADLKQGEPSRKVKFVIESGVRVKGDQNLLAITLRNLFENAWKFTSKHPEARIEFGAKTSESKTVYFIRDDGAGFDMQAAGKLFGAFQRLHQEDDFPGTGIGLGMVERIIRRHKGRIWAEAGVEKGATFFFTLNTEVQ